jgi:Xaa-Pro aminopeptidase
LTEIEQRRLNASGQLAQRKVDAFLVSSPANVRYLTGFAGSNSLMLLTPGEQHFFTDPRYGTDAAANITCRVHVAKGPLIAAAAAVVKRKRLKRIGFEPAWLQVDQFESLRKALGAARTLVASPSLIEDLRMVKSNEEIAAIRSSVEANSEAYSRTLRRLRPGLREREIAAELDFQMRVLGAEKSSFDTIVAAGIHSALPHYHPASHRLGDNELLLIDMGATLAGYTSDMTRVTHIGTPPKRVRDLYKAVLEAQLGAIDAVRPGVPAGRVDGAARKILKAHKLDRVFIHSTGHGLGLEIHEAPRVGRKEKTRLKPGMVITIEPGAYIEGFGGVRIEDTVLVTERGCEVLTPTPKELVAL